MALAILCYQGEEDMDEVVSNAVNNTVKKMANEATNRQGMTPWWATLCMGLFSVGLWGCPEDACVKDENGECIAGVTRLDGGTDAGVLECDAGKADCDGDPANGCEVDLNMDPGHCGGCGNVCTADLNQGALCNGGMCEVGGCAVGYGDCNADLGDGCERNLNDFANCGACGNECNMGEMCLDLACKTVVPSTWLRAPGNDKAWCTNLEFDANGDAYLFMQHSGKLTIGSEQISNDSDPSRTVLHVNGNGSVLDDDTISVPAGGGNAFWWLTFDMELNGEGFPIVVSEYKGQLNASGVGSEGNSGSSSQSIIRYYEDPEDSDWNGFWAQDSGDAPTFAVGYASGTDRVLAGGRLTSGASETFGGTTIMSGATSKALLVQYSAAGTYVSHLMAGGDSNTWVLGIEVAADGSIYVLGRAGGGTNMVLGTKSFLVNGTGDNIWLAKLSSDASAVSWITRVSTNTYALDSTLATSSDGSVYVGTRLKGSVTLGLSTVSSSVGEEGLLVRVLPDGNVSWFKQLALTDGLGYHSVTVDDVGNVYGVATIVNSLSFEGYAYTGLPDENNMISYSFASDGVLRWYDVGVGHMKSNDIEVHDGYLYACGWNNGDVTVGNETTITHDGSGPDGFVIRYPIQ